MQFSNTLTTLQGADGTWRAQVGEDWSQGRAVFGGLVAALGNAVMRTLVPSDRALRALETVFAGPVLPGAEATLEAKVLRVGRAVTIANARIESGGSLAATLTGIYGAARPVSIVLEPATPAGIPPAAALPDTPIPADLRRPAFTQHFHLKFAEGARPYSGSPLRHSKVYVRHAEQAAFSEAHLIALIDCIPPPLVQMMKNFVANSSLTWTLEFLRHDFDCSTADWWRIDTEVRGAGEGYSQESSLVLDPQGRPAALSRQLVAVFG
jgi:acyl-CoA thioesterase